MDEHWILDTEHSILLTGVDRVCALSRRFDGSMWPAAVWLIWRSQRVWSSKQRRKQKVATSSQEFRTRMLSASSKKTFKCLAAKRPNRSHCDDGRDSGPTSALPHTYTHTHVNRQRHVWQVTVARLLSQRLLCSRSDGAPGGGNDGERRRSFLLLFGASSNNKA